MEWGCIREIKTKKERMLTHSFQISSCHLKYLFGSKEEKIQKLCHAGTTFY